MKSYLGNGCYVEWKLKDGTFSASGEIWNKMGTDIESGGQILDMLVEMFPDNEQLFLLHRIWKRYHLNDMRPGSPIQTRLVREEIEPLYELIKENHQQLQKDYWELRTVLFKQIEKKKFNIHYSAAKYFEGLVNLILNGKGDEKWMKRISTFYLREGQQVSQTRGGYPGLHQSMNLGAKAKQLIVDYHSISETPDYYTFCCQELEKRGRFRDPDYIVKETATLSSGDKVDVEVAYKYGSRWLKEELPEEVVEEINSWTETKRTTLTPAEQFVEDNDCVVKYVEFKDNMNWYKLRVNDKVDFDFQAGTAHTNVDAVQIINCLLDEARDSSQGLDYCLDYCDDLGYSGKESIRIANALVENWEKMCEVGLNLLIDDEED